MEEIKKIFIYDNLTRGKIENIGETLEDPRCRIFPLGGDIRDTGMLDTAMKGLNYVFHLAALWLLHGRFSKNSL